MIDKKIIIKAHNNEYTEYTRHRDVYYYDPYFVDEKNEVLSADPCF